MPIGINKVDGSMHVLFPKNQPLPDYKTRTLTTSKDNQRSIMLKIYQGEASLCADNELLGTFVFSGIRPAPKGKVQIEVTFHIDSEGILNLTARDKSTGQTVESTLKLGKSGGVEVIGGTPAPTAEKPESQPGFIAPPLLPFTMPTSSLASSIGGAPPAGPAEALLPSETTMEEAKPDSMRPAEAAPAVKADVAVKQSPAEVAADPHADDKTERAPLRPLVVAPAQTSGWASFVSWCKGIFGGN
jgi:hypothetical protein